MEFPNWDIFKIPHLNFPWNGKFLEIFCPFATLMYILSYIGVCFEGRKPLWPLMNLLAQPVWSPTSSLSFTRRGNMSIKRSSDLGFRTHPVTSQLLRYFCGTSQTSPSMAPYSERTAGCQSWHTAAFINSWNCSIAVLLLGKVGRHLRKAADKYITVWNSFPSRLFSDIEFRTTLAFSYLQRAKADGLGIGHQVPWREWDGGMSRYVDVRKESEGAETLGHSTLNWVSEESSLAALQNDFVKVKTCPAWLRLTKGGRIHCVLSIPHSVFHSLVPAAGCDSLHTAFPSRVLWLMAI